MDIEQKKQKLDEYGTQDPTMVDPTMVKYPMSGDTV